VLRSWAKPKRSPLKDLTKNSRGFSVQGKSRRKKTATPRLTKSSSGEKKACQEKRGSTASRHEEHIPKGNPERDLGGALLGISKRRKRIRGKKKKKKKGKIIRRKNHLKHRKGEPLRKETWSGQQLRKETRGKNSRKNLDCSNRHSFRLQGWGEKDKGKRFLGATLKKSKTRSPGEGNRTERDTLGTEVERGNAIGRFLCQ